MASACSSPPWGRVRGSPNGNSAGSPSKLAPTDAKPERPCSRNTNSPEESCAICLGPPENKSFTDSCLHQFCFACLAEWAKVKAECPLCKQRFKSIIHSVRSLEDYDQYFVSDLQRPPALHTQVYEQRFRYPTTMTFERRQELEAVVEGHERSRHARHFAATSNNRNRYLPRGATTSDERLHLYLLDLWAVPCTSHYREASPEFYRENPACTHRLVPWINRELNALLRQNRSRVVAAMDHVMGLILSFDIRHPQFARNMEPFLGEYTEHFVHEFYMFATSVYDMADYDTHTIYMSGRYSACLQANPVERFRQTLRESEQAAQITQPPNSPQPGPSGFSVYREEEVVATSVDSDSSSESSDCVVVKVVKPARERTPVVIELLSSDEEELVSRDNCQAGPSNQEAGPSSSSGPPEDRKPHKRCAGTDSSSSDMVDEYSQKRRAPRRPTSESSSSDARDRRPRKRHLRTRKRCKTECDSELPSERRVSSSRSRWKQQREERRGEDRSRQSSSTSSDRFGHPPPPRPRKLVSVLGAVSISGKSCETSDQERRHSRRQRRERRSKKKSTRKHKHRRRSPSPEF